MTYFTIKCSAAGIGDQITQISLLYTFGKLLSYKYVHTPINCWRTSPSIGKFTGIDNWEITTEKKELKNYQIIEVALDQILMRESVKNLLDCKKEISNLISSLYNDRNYIIALLWTGNMYKYMSKLNSINGRTIIHEKLNRKNFTFPFSKLYSKSIKNFSVNLPFVKNKLKIAVHVRRGDTAHIVFKNKIFYGDGTCLQSLKNAPRQQIELAEFDYLLEKIFSLYGEDKFSVIILSDGYERTFRYIRAQKNQIGLSEFDLKELDQIEEKCNEDLYFFQQKYNNVCSSIIGESEEKLFQSIHTIVSADIVISSIGNFAGKVRLFAPPEHDSVILPVRNYNEQDLKSIENLIIRADF